MLFRSRAIQDYDQAIKLNPSFVQAYNNRGRAYLAKGDYDRGIRDFGRAIGLDPSSAMAHRNMSLALIRQGKPREAVRYYRHAGRLLDNQPQVLNNLSWVLATDEDAQFRDGAEAVRLAKRACELTEYKLPYTLDTLAAAYAEAG